MIFNNAVCATSKSSSASAYALASRLNILLLIGYCPILIWDLKEVVQARLSLHLSKCHIVENHMTRFIYILLAIQCTCSGSCLSATYINNLRKAIIAWN